MKVLITNKDNPYFSRVLEFSTCSPLDDWGAVICKTDEIGNSSIFREGEFICLTDVPKNNLTSLVEGSVGVLVYIMGGNRGKTVKPLGLVSKYVVNPHVNELQFMIEGNEESMYAIKRGYVVKN